MSSIVVNQSGAELSYIDSGAPNGPADYVTIFAIHGTVFTGRKSFSCAVAHVYSE